MLRTILALRFLPGALLALLIVASATAQTPKLNKRPYKDTQNGYRFLTPADWDATPVKPEEKGLGLLYQMDGGRFGEVELYVFKLPPKGKDGERAKLESLLTLLFSKSTGFKKDDILEDEVEEISDLEARHRRWEGRYTYIDTWTFPLPEYDVALIYLVGMDHKHTKRWLQIFRRSARSFDVMEAEGTGEVAATSSYEDQLAFHQAEAERTPGWRALPTRSKNFIIKTSSDDDGFLKEVIERLELSRKLYERDFPPKGEFNHVSVVRVCGSRAEFQKYGGVGGGVAGYFNPGTIELVLYDAKETNRNATYAVMSHEAFHQYCYFLFEQSEAHRWFDEGHGDYYGGAEFKRGRAEITPQMPGGLDRLGVIREMVRQGTYAPIREHLNYSHREWQNQGPTNVSCYAQSWSIVYMLREGTLGNVSRKYWRKEYANIIPAYVKTLYEGFRDAYEDQRKEDLAEAQEKAGGKGRSVALSNKRRPLPPEVKARIWEEATAAAWSAIDFEEFEKSWTEYVIKGLK